METLLQVVHIVDAVVLVVVVLLQQGRGAGMGLAFGGGSTGSVFGGAGAGNILSKITAVAAVIFMVTSLSLAYLSGRQSTSLMEDVEAPATQEAPAEPVGGAVTEPTTDEATGTTAPAAGQVTQ